MLKHVLSMKEEVARAGEALRQLLEKIPVLQIEGIEVDVVSGGWGPDLIARLLADKRQHALI